MRLEVGHWRLEVGGWRSIIGRCTINLFNGYNYMFLHPENEQQQNTHGQPPRSRYPPGCVYRGWFGL